ncbi:MAG: radical SAM protein [Anaerolineaceae bacterium]
MPVLVPAPVVPVPARVAVVRNSMVLRDLFSVKMNKPTVVELKPGLYAYHRNSNGDKAQIHLRVDEDSSGLLVINAARIMHLNPTALRMARLYLEQVPQKEALRTLSALYNVPAKQLKQDYELTAQKIETLISGDGSVCPVCDLGLDIDMPFSRQLSAPYRMDLAITYRCNNACAHCYNARPRNYPELSTDQWKTIIDKVWKNRIPHVVFTGGEPTLREDLVDLISYAQKTGLVCGLNTNGRKLADPAYLEQLKQAGLDHVQITLESADEDVHDHMVRAKGAWKETVQGVRNAVNSGLYMMTNSTLLRDNVPHLTALLNFLKDLGVPTVGLNALIYSGRGKEVDTGLKETELPPLLNLAKAVTQANNQRLIWYTPTQYCHFDPMQLELGIKGCTAAMYNMCVEPDGQVIPCQSFYEPIGSLLSGTWQDIWNHPLALDLRHRKNIPEGCIYCDLLPECGGGCPLAREHQNVQPVIQSIH